MLRVMYPFLFRLYRPLINPTARCKTCSPKYIAPEELVEQSKEFIGAQLDFLLLVFLCLDEQVLYISKFSLKVICVHYGIIMLLGNVVSFEKCCHLCLLYCAG